MGCIGPPGRSLPTPGVTVPTQEREGPSSLLHVLPVVYTFNGDITTQASVAEFVCTHCKYNKSNSI